MKDANRFLLPAALLVLNGCLAGSPEQFFGYDLSHSTTSAAFKNIKPAIAVRGASCLSCHANVKSNLITDFGYGNDYFLDRAGDGWAAGSFYFNHGLNSWQTAQISGSMIIPRVTLQRPTHAGPMNTVDPNHVQSQMSLADLIQAPVIANMDGGSIGNLGAITAGVRNVAGPSVTEKNHVEIKAPSLTDILKATPELNSVNVGFAQTYLGAIPLAVQAQVSGLTVVQAGAQSYVRTNSDPFVCAGDIVVKGTLFLKNANIVTSGYGCHLYVTGSVFIQGEVKLNGGHPTDTENLQITSARAVMMGFDSASTLERMSLPGSSRAWVLPFAYTRGVGTNQEKHQVIYNDSLKIPDLVDGRSTPTTFAHVLLNAPEIHSRYEGDFKGALVGEIILFVLSEFSFTYDPVFEQIPVLPALNMEILRVED